MLNPSQYFQTKLWPSVGLAAFRVVMGSAFVLHGLPKTASAFSWMGTAPIPGVLQAAAAYSEVVGGAALAVGFCTPLASLSLIGTMIGALGLAHLPSGDPFVSGSGGSSYELALVYLTGALLFLLNSPGKLSVDYWLLKALSKGNLTQVPES